MMKNFLQIDRDKLKLFKKHGYDILGARKKVVAQARLRGLILDVGTGRGHLAMALAKKGLHVVSVDADRKPQKIARAHLKAEGLQGQVTLKIMNAERLRFKDAFFDGVISVNFLHHARRPWTCIDEMLRVTKQTLVLADSNKKGERIMDRVHAEEKEKHPRSRISMREVGPYLKKAGLSVKVYKNECETVVVARKTAPHFS
jgi:ubiquinone/menaquinone biosynthesis C-methylase UbiE